MTPAAETGLVLLGRPARAGKESGMQSEWTVRVGFTVPKGEPSG
jgi:hypothetical protein